jgi:hypothetical protein
MGEIVIDITTWNSKCKKHICSLYAASTKKMTKSNYLSFGEYFKKISRKSKSCGHAHLHYVYKHPTKY